MGTYKLIVADQAGNVSALDESNTVTTEDTISPSFVAAGTIYFTIIDMTFDEELAGTTADPSAFAVHTTSGEITVENVEIAGTQLTIHLSTNIKWADTVTIDYAASGTNDLADASGNRVDDFTGKPVGNNVE